MAGPGLEILGREELLQVREVLESGYLARYGPGKGFPAKVRNFEEEVARRAGVGHALAVNSGTSALYLALTGLGIGPGDEVIVPGFTFVASMSAVAYARARPVPAEVDLTFNLDPDDVEAKIGPRTRAILAVHMLGNPARLAELRRVAERHGLALVEDAAQAFGATYRGKWVGGHGEAGIYSFNIYKTITCGDGGMLVTDDEDLYRRCFALHDQGHRPHRLGVEIGQRPMLGLNFRMVELQGAVLLAQIGKLERILAHLRNNRDLVVEALAGLQGVSFAERPDPDGDLGTHLVLVFPSAGVARRVATDLGSITLADSGWHVYNHMEHLLGARTASGRGCPFDCPGTDDRPPGYRKGMLPRTDALLDRSMSIGIGVVDPNLAPLGLGMRAGPDRASRLGRRIRAVIARHL